MSLAYVITALGTSGAIFCCGYALLTLLDRYHHQLEARMQSLPRQTASRDRQGAQSKPANSPWLQHFNGLVPNSQRDQSEFRARLAQAGLQSPFALSAFFTARLICMTAPLLIAMLGRYLGLLEPAMAMFAGCLLGAVGVTLPSMWLHHRITRRHAALRKSLPDLLDLMIICLQSGQSLPATIQRVSDELSLAFPLLAEELSLVQRDIELGTPVDVAFRRFAERTNLSQVRTLSGFIREAQRYGSELIDALRSHADMMRHQREQAAEEMAQKASVKILFPTLLLILPGIFVIVAGPALIQIQEAFAKHQP